MNRALLLILLALPATALAEAKVYRWVDAQGQVHYSQTPPPHIGAEAHSIKTVPASAPPAAVATPAVKPAAPAQAAPKIDEKAEREARTKRCAAARERIVFLEEKTARRLGTEQADGTLSRMTDEEFEQRLKQARDEASKNCVS